MTTQAAREQALEEEEKRKAYERELEIARLLALQEQAADQVAERQALEAKRQQEAVERAQRAKELEEAKKKKLLADQVRLICMHMPGTAFNSIR